MLTYTTYSEAGGVGKTTLASNLADAHGQHDRDVLVIDLDPQNGSLTYLLGVDAPRDDSNADNIARHLIDRPKGAFEDLILETPFGFDLVPSHNMLENLADLLTRAASMAEDLGEEFERHDQLRQVLLNADIPEKYDTIVVDPPATAGPHLYNAIGATRSLVIPLEPTGKGMQSIEGLQDVVQGFEETVGVTVGVLAVVPNGVGRTTDQQRTTRQSPLVSDRRCSKAVGTSRRQHSRTSMSIDLGNAIMKWRRSSSYTNSPAILRR
ncbi:ATPase involved in chromosome partitioning-like protein [Halorubrum distributum JCM 13916]|uniref:ATPase involved in chromosome partitioning-like protein n=1 Tax=Halorubrum distributum JCM 13916 TaxID=1230455 RepID=M0PRX7_9EURY|nr:ParA family protein [Halorubrum arcis]EMA72772.1 ATPase involved in chromosome partitioning-like protein [Halorubrum arcis JCM 13916]